MEIEGWHLDVVEGFLAEVRSGGAAAAAGSGGWDEAQIVKRVFALLVGEERRRLGLVPPRRGELR